MKKIIFPVVLGLSLATTLTSCEPTKVIIVNRETNTATDGPMLLGTQSKSQLKKAPYNDWYDKEYEEYAVDAASIEQLKKAKIKSYNLVVVMGTWCEDSHREVPRLMKILETLEYPDSKLTIIAVNHKKEAPSGEEGVYNIQRIPTIIVKKYGKEIGRIVESPKTGWLEQDLLNIIKKD